MTEFELINKAAFQRAPMPTFAKQHEQYAYLSMRFVYGEYARKNLTREQAKGERDRIQKAYEVAATAYDTEMKQRKQLDRMRINMATLSKRIKSEGCLICQEMLRLMDGGFWDENDEEDTQK